MKPKLIKAHRQKNGNPKRRAVKAARRTALPAGLGITHLTIRRQRPFSFSCPQTHTPERPAANNAPNAVWHVMDLIRIPKPVRRGEAPLCGTVASILRKNFIYRLSARVDHCLRVNQLKYGVFRDEKLLAFGSAFGRLKGVDLGLGLNFFFSMGGKVAAA